MSPGNEMVISAKLKVFENGSITCYMLKLLLNQVREE